MARQTIRDSIISAFHELGETTLHLSQIYWQVRIIRERRGIDIGDYDVLNAYIRWTLQNNSRGRGKDVFIMIRKGSGLWAIRENI